jgi:hypothetical protein
MAWWQVAVPVSTRPSGGGEQQGRFDTPLKCNTAYPVMF